jgi:hypothetical protein
MDRNQAEDRVNFNDRPNAKLIIEKRVSIPQQKLKIIRSVDES